MPYRKRPWKIYSTAPMLKVPKKVKTKNCKLPKTTVVYPPGKKYRSESDKYFEKKVYELETDQISVSEFSCLTGVCEEAAKRRLWQKKWLNASKCAAAKNRVWKNCMFIGDEFFFTRLKGKKTTSTIYHICNEYKNMIVYALVEKSNEPVCTNCEKKAPKGMVLASRLKKLNV